MSHQINSKRTVVDIDKVLEKGETSLKDQMKLFIAQSGKHLAIAIATIITFVITGQIVPESLFVTTFVLIPLVLIAIIIYFIYYSSNKAKEELRSDLLALASSHKNLGDNLVTELVNMEKKLVGRINTLEAYTPFGILEMDNKGNLLRSNQAFQYVTGYNENTLNTLLHDLPPSLKVEHLAELLAETDDVDRLKAEFKSRINGDTEAKEYKNLYLRNKDGILFPATMRVALIHDKRGLIAQYYIADETDTRAMLETIQGQNDTINKLILAFTKHHNEREFTDKLIRELEKSKLEIRSELRN